MTALAQTWDSLEAVLKTIKYTRDVPPAGHDARFEVYRDDENNYAVLYIFTYQPNTYHPERMRHTRHEFVLPVATYNRETWVRWVFDQIAKIEIHEACEAFQVNGERVYAPHHGNGWDPYAFWPASDAVQKAKAPGED